MCIPETVTLQVDGYKTFYPTEFMSILEKEQKMVL